jgi:hypothetical protein
MLWDFYQNSKVEVTSKVFPGARAEKYTSTKANDQFTFSNIAVPEGSKISVYPAGDNTGGLYFIDPKTGTKAPLKSGKAFAWTNFQNGTFELTDDSDTAYALAEVDG